MFPYLPAIKLATQVVAGLGVSKILGDVIRNNVVIATKTQAVTVRVGTFVLGSMLWDQSSNHIEKATNDAVALIEKLKENKDETEEKKDVS